MSYPTEYQRWQRRDRIVRHLTIAAWYAIGMAACFAAAYSINWILDP